MSLRFRIEQLLPQLRWLGYLIRMHPRHLLGEVFQVCHTVRRLQDRPRTQWRDYIFWPGLVKPSCPLGWTRGRGWSSGWMDGWMNGSWKTSACPTPLEEHPALSQQWISLLSLLGFVNLNLWLQHASLCGTAHNRLIENPEPCPSQKIEIAFVVPLGCSGVFNPVQFIVMDGWLFQKYY